MKSPRRSYLVELDISVISIISQETNRERQLSMAQSINDSLVVGDEIADHCKSARWR